MKTSSFMQAAEAFVAEACRTDQSRTSTLSTLRQLHDQYSGDILGGITATQLTTFCLANDPAPATVKARRSRIMAFYAWCAWQKLIDKNPASELKYTAKAGKGGGVRQHTWLSVAEYKALLAAQPDTFEGKRARIILMLGGMLGLRRSEIADLRASDFSTDFKSVTLVGKGGKLATLGVPGELQTALTVWMSSRFVNKEIILPVMVHTSREDLPAWTNPISGGTVASIVSAAGLLVGIHFEVHDLRRSFCNMLEEMGYSLQDTCRMMRHENVGTTSAYMEKNPRRTTALAGGFRLDIGGTDGV